MELDDVLNDKVEVKDDPVATEIQQREHGERVTSRRKEWREKELDARAEGEGKKRDPVTGQFVPKEEVKEGEDSVAGAGKEEKKEVAQEQKPEPKPEAKEELSAKERAFLAGLQEERRKRQELEQQIAELRKASDPPKSFYEDPEAALKARDEAILLARQEMAQQRFQDRLLTVEEIARMKYNDYDQVIEVFKELANNTPGLAHQCASSPNPAEFAYKLAKSHKELRDAGSIDELKGRMEKELRARLEAEYKQKYDQQMKERAALVPSLSDAHATQQNRAVWGGPTPLDNVLGG